MRATRQERRSALWQLIAVLAVIAALAVVARIDAQQPADAAELRIPISELRSDAAELGTVDDDKADGELPRRVAQAHLRQLARNTRDSWRALAQLAVEPALEVDRADALADAASLMAAISASRALSPVPRQNLDRLRTHLEQLERGLRR